MSSALSLKLLLASLGVLRADIPWVATFFNQSEGTALCALTKGSRSEADCDHMTVVYNPPKSTMAKLRHHFGERVVVRALAVAHDEHARAVMVHLESGTAAAISANDWPHSTIAHGAAPYSPVYSNCLWERAVAASNALVTRDSRGKPTSIAFPAAAQVWHGVLVEGKCSGGDTVYPATNATIELLNQADIPREFGATLCDNAEWQREEGRCIHGM
ncbi:hypothetical protein AB1Y20_019856 [Prymnesium parvum]|uniref:Uncharacterized protein n=1 Tax=Prymnesium parvum TaxID=97485 RepID=A0AB34JWD9_PRYPA